MNRLIKNLNYAFSYKNKFRHDLPKIFLSMYNSPDWLEYVDLSDNDFDINVIKRNDKYRLEIASWDVGSKIGPFYTNKNYLFKTLYGELVTHYKHTSTVHTIPGNELCLIKKDRPCEILSTRKSYSIQIRY